MHLSEEKSDDSKDSFYDKLEEAFVNFLSKKVKVKESHNRPGVAQSVPGGLGFQISMTFGT